MPTVITEFAYLDYDEELSVLHVEMLPDKEIRLEHTVAHYNLIKEITRGRPHIMLVNAANYYRIDPDALKYSAEHHIVFNRVASAHYNCSVANSLTVNFFKNQVKPAIPVGIFKTKGEALTWIRQLISEGILNSNAAASG